jgi:hypothetical protein
VNILRQAAPAALATALSVALATGLAACGLLSSSSSAGSVSSSSASAPASSSAGAATSSSSAGAGGGGSQSGGTDPLASLTATQVLNEATVDTNAASSLHVTGTVADAGQTITFNLDSAKGKGCIGTLAEGTKGSFQLILLGTTVWIKPDATFWKTSAGATDSAVLSLLEGKYLKSSTGSSGLSSLSQICSLSNLLGQLKSTNLTKGPVSTASGTPVLQLSDTVTNDMAYVTDQTAPLFVRITATGANGGTLTFSNYNAPVNIVAPPATEVIDGSKYGF